LLFGALYQAVRSTKTFLFTQLKAGFYPRAKL
jgi:hypothetical protein